MPHTIIWLCNQPTPYNDYLFRTLSSDPEIRLTVYYEHDSSSSYPWTSPFGGGYDARYCLNSTGLNWPLYRFAALKPNALFLIGGWKCLGNLILLVLLTITNARYALWTDTPNLIRKRNKVFAILRSALLSTLFRRATRVLGTGYPALSALREMGCPGEKLVNFPYFIDVTQHEPRYEPSDPTRTALVSVGRLSYEKGYDLALGALARLKKNGGVVFHYRIAGDGPERHRLEGLIREYGLSGDVECVGWLEPSQLRTFLSSGDGFLHPARHEPYGVAVLEAMAAGLVVIASDATTAAVDRIRNGENGFLHRAGDMEHLYSQLIGVLNMKELGTIRREARRTAEQWDGSVAVGIIKTLLET